MIRRAFTMRLKPDALAEYKEYHDNIWPELVAEIERAGIASITTFQRDLDLFLVSEIADETAWDKLWNSEVHKRWAEVMQPLMHLREDGIVEAGELNEVFHITVGGAGNGRVSILAVTNPEPRSELAMEIYGESMSVPASPAQPISEAPAPVAPAPAASAPKPARKMVVRRAKKATVKKAAAKKRAPAKKSKRKAAKAAKKKTAKKKPAKKKAAAKKSKKTAKKKRRK
jgi:L-rhamnose mutarotase